MAEGMTARIDPETGERTETRFDYTPYVPPPMQLNPEAVNELLKNQKADEAAKRIAAAQAFLAQRGYEKDMTEAALQSDPIKQSALRRAAAVKWMPVMFSGNRQSGAAMMRALTPPTMTPYQEAQIKLARERFEFTKTNKPAMTPYQQATIDLRKAPKPALDTVVEKYPEVVAKPERTGWFGRPAVTGVPEHTIRRQIPRGQGASNAPPAAVVAPAPAPPQAVGGYIIGRLYKGGLRYLGGDPKLEESWEKLK